MREYKIKRGHNPDINELVKKHFGEEGDIEEGMNFEVEGIGKIDMKKDKKYLIIDIEPPKKVSGDYNIIKTWNQFLYEATGFDSKERKKQFGKIKKKK